MTDLERPAKCMKAMVDDVERFDKAFPKYVDDVMKDSDFQDLEIGEAVTRLKEVRMQPLLVITNKICLRHEARAIKWALNFRKNIIPILAA